jgi:lactam utilization protein B
LQAVGAGRSHIDASPQTLRQKLAQQSGCHWATANVAGADHEYVKHDTVFRVDGFWW